MICLMPFQMPSCAEIFNLSLFSNFRNWSKGSPSVIENRRPGVLSFGQNRRGFCAVQC